MMTWPFGDTRPPQRKFWAVVDLWLETPADR